MKHRRQALTQLPLTRMALYQDATAASGAYEPSCGKHIPDTPGKPLSTASNDLGRPHPAKPKSGKNTDSYNVVPVWYNFRFIRLPLLCLAIVGIYGTSGAQVQVERRVLSSAGHSHAAGNLHLDWTMGQTGASFLEAGSQSLQQGFHQVLCSLQGSLSLTASADTLTCSRTSITLTGVTDIPNVEVSWTRPDGSTVNGPTLQATVPGTYSFRVRQGSCSRLESLELFSDTTPPSLTLSRDRDTLTCAHPIATLLALTGSNATYSWSTGATDSILSVQTGGAYTVTVTNGRNGCSSSAGVNLAVDKVPPVLTPLADLTLDCTTDTLFTQAASPDPGVFFQWSGQPSPGPELVIVGAGTYVVTATGPNGCTATESVEVFSGQGRPIVDLESSSLVLTCVTDSITLSADSDVSGGAAFAWSGPGNFINSDSMVRIGLPGLYTVTATNPATACKETQTILIGENRILPLFSVPDTDQLTCSKPSQLLFINLENAQGGADYQYEFTPPGQGTEVIVRTDPFLEVDQAGIWAIRVRNLTNGCLSLSSTTVINSVITTPPVAIRTEEIRCDVATLSYDGPAVASSGIRWFTPDTIIVGVVMVDVKLSGLVSLEITDTNGCRNTATLNLVLNESEPLTFLSPNEDGKNDKLRVNRCGDPGPFGFTLFNRWGVVLLETPDFDRDFPDGWDGTLRGSPVPDGQYYYILEHQGAVIKSPLTILR